MLKEPINIGVIGVGHLGQHHVKHYKSIEDANLIGIFDIDNDRAEKIGNKYDVPIFQKIEYLLDQVDAVSIVTPTPNHIEAARQCIDKKKHVFIEKPITVTLEEADELLKLSNEKGVLIQVGHIERLNPALIALKPYPIEPKFIEIQRLAPYTTRGTDVPVVLDKMIHDIDILLSLVKSPVKNIKATGLSILTGSLDIAHARIRFENGTVASIMSSRVAKDEVRKVKIFQKNLYTTMDLLLGLTEVYKIIDNKDNNSEAVMTVPLNNSNEEKFIAYEKPEVPNKDPLKMELQNFISSIKGKETPIVSGKDGRDALKVAIEIQEMIIKDIH
jgi:predicted dehydrogenase